MEFKEWLKKEKGYSEKSARDVQSRLKRATTFLKDKEKENPIAELENINEFKALSISVKSQLRKSIKLHNEFITKND